MDTKKERIADRELLVHKIAVDTKTAERIVEEDKTKLFATLGLFRPRPEEIECESIQLVYEPFLVAKATYFLDYYQNRTYTIRTDENVSEVVALGQVFKPEPVRGGLCRRPSKAIAIDVQERVIHRAATHMALNRRGREVNPTRLPSGPTEPEPKGTLEEDSDRVHDLEISPDTIVDRIRKRTAKRPVSVGRIKEETFDVTEYVLVCTPIYEARCRRLKTSEIKILPISGVTGKPLRL